PYRDDVLADAAARVRRFREAARRLVGNADSPPDLRPHRDAFFSALAADFNTPGALAALHAWVDEANRREDVGDRDMREMLRVLGLENLLDAAPEAPAELMDIALRRDDARKDKDFETADRLRDELREQGWEVRDGAQG